MSKRPETAVIGTKLRMKEALRKQIEAAARKRGVSMNAEMVDRLERSFSDARIEDMFQQILTRLA